MKSEKSEIKIRGMICRSCVAEVEEALLHTRGIISANVSYIKASAKIEYDPDITSLSAIETQLKHLGYDCGSRGVGGISVDILCLILTGLLTYLLLHIGMSDMSGLNAGVSFGSIFLLGLMTSPHCLFMCGGIMLGTACSDNNKEFSKASLAYNLGRIFSYTVIGAIFGTLGTVITYSMSVKSMVFTLVGLLVVLIGLNMWGLLPFLHVLAPQQATACRLPGTARKRFHGRPMIIGMLTGLMPCGSLYAMWLHAISGGSAAYGAVIMLCFALGTAPMMFLFGSLGSLFPRRWNKYFLKISAVLVCSMGLKMLINGLKMLH